MTRSAFFTIPLLCLVTACLDSLTNRDQDLVTPPGTRSPVIQGWLDPSATVQVLWVEWSIPADSTGGFDPRPIDPGQVTLNLIGPDGTPVPLIPGSPGEYSAQIQVMPDSVYRLEGMIADSTITATVRIPDSVRLFNPVGDTVRIARKRNGIITILRFPYEFTSRGASVFILNTEDRLNSAFYPRSYLLRASHGVQELQAFGDTLLLNLEAYERFGGEWLVVNEHPAASNISGAYGFLGALTRSKSIVVIAQ